MSILKLKDVSWGKTDAKNEFLDDSKENQQRFMRSFLTPDNFRLEDFSSGERFFITGLKGSGKTALLRYINCAIGHAPKTLSHFILFKSDFSKVDKDKLTNAAHWSLSLTEDKENLDDFENVWEWYFHRKIVKLCEDNNFQLFENNTDWKRYKAYILSPVETADGLFKTFPKLKRGKMKVKVDAGPIGIELDGEFEPGSTSVKQVLFSSMVERVKDLFKKLKPLNTKLYLFVDELELSYTSRKQFDRDVKMIRDLIVTIYKLNECSRKKSFGLFVVTGIRSEVLTSVGSLGKEINKPVADFGINLKWMQAGGDILSHPLLKIVQKRLLIAKGDTSLVGDDAALIKVWNEFFPEQLFGVSAGEAILNKTWYRPRDIVRLFSLVQQYSPDSEMFTQQSFEKINKDYSRECWTESAEELITKYSKDEIAGIEKILMTIECPFSIDQLIEHANKQAQYYQCVESFLEKYSHGELLEHLYRLGIIGNVGKHYRFAFRGDDQLNITQNMSVHNALWNYFSITRRFHNE